MTADQASIRRQAATHRHHPLRSMGWPLGVLAAAALLFAACARAPDRVVTEGPIEGETQTQTAPAAHTASHAQSETELPLCSDIDLPETCDIGVTDAGFFAIAPGLPPWFPARYYSCPYASDCYPVLHYSSDGLTWRAVDTPTRYVGANRYSGHDDIEFPIWVCSVESTATGVIIREAIEFDAWRLYDDYGDDYLGLDTCNEVTYWSADGDLTNWRKLLAPPPGFD